MYLDDILTSLYLPIWRPSGGILTGVRTGNIYRGLRKSEWWSRKELELLQKKKLQKLLFEAVQNVPYYQKSVYLEISADSPPRETLAQLPILTRDAIRAAGGLIRLRNCKRVERSRTGGTTGEPLEIWRNLESVSLGTAALWRGKAWAGIRPWQRAVLIQGFGKASLRGRLLLRILRKWSVQAFQTGADARQEVIELIRQVQPASVEGFVTDLLSLTKHEIPLASAIRAVLTTGEMLYKEQRRDLEQAFGAPVFSYYGCNEVSALAFECEHQVKHVTDEHVIIETVNDAGLPVWEEPGRILVTDLDNSVMPLVRYELGDVGILTRKSCACGRNLLVLKELLGRQQDAIRNESGEALSATFFAGRFRKLQHVGGIQLVQHAIDFIEIFFEGEESSCCEELRSIVNEIHLRLGSHMKISTTRVERIPQTAAGKRLLIRGLAT